METMKMERENETAGGASCCTMDGDDHGHEGNVDPTHHDHNEHCEIPDTKGSEEIAGTKIDHRRHAHHAHHAQHGHHAPKEKESNFRLAVAATLHCLVGCGIGEIVGVIIGTALGLDMWTTMGLGLSLGVVFGLALGVIPLLRGGFVWRDALRMVMVAEGLSILVMETAEALVQIYTPGVMMAGLTDGLFWIGMGIALAAGFLAALPVNVWLVSRGIRHAH